MMSWNKVTPYKKWHFLVSILDLRGCTLFQHKQQTAPNGSKKRPHKTGRRDGSWWVVAWVLLLWRCSSWWFLLQNMVGFGFRSAIKQVLKQKWGLPDTTWAKARWFWHFGIWYFEHFDDVIPDEQWKNTGWLSYTGDYTTQLYWDYNKPL